jgi:HK97 family phage portal protein
MGDGLSLFHRRSFIREWEAESLNAVMAAVNAISSAIATLEAGVYQRTPAGRVEAPAHPVAALVRAPNAFQTWPDFIEWLIASTLIAGNGLAEIISDGSGRPAALIPIPWRFVRPLLLPSGRLAFDVTAHPPLWGGMAPQRRLLSSEVLHLKDRSEDGGYIGGSRISRAPGAILNALDEQDYTRALWANGATPRGVIQVPKALSETAWERFKADIRETHVGLRNSGKTLILEDGATFESLSMSPEDAQVLQSRKFSVEEVCRLFNVPPPILQDYSNNTFTNAATASVWFGTNTLRPWVRKIEAEFARSVFGPQSDFELDLDLSSLTRGDFAARWAAYDIAIRDRILTPNEIREAEGYNARPGGDEFEAPASQPNA